VSEACTHSDYYFVVRVVDVILYEVNCIFLTNYFWQEFLQHTDKRMEEIKTTLKDKDQVKIKISKPFKFLNPENYIFQPCLLTNVIIQNTLNTWLCIWKTTYLNFLLQFSSFTKWNCFQEIVFLKAMILKLTERIDRMEKTVDIRIGKYWALSLVVLAVVGSLAYDVAHEKQEPTRMPIHCRVTPQRTNHEATALAILAVIISFNSCWHFLYCYVIRSFGWEPNKAVLRFTGFKAKHLTNTGTKYSCEMFL